MHTHICLFFYISLILWIFFFQFQGNDDDRMWLVCYHQALGGAEQGEKRTNVINYSVIASFHTRLWVCLFVCASVSQVALSVAAEFWEQGDLERTVLEQQPIVSLQIIVENMFFLLNILFIFIINLSENSFKYSSQCLCFVWPTAKKNPKLFKMK